MAQLLSELYKAQLEEWSSYITNNRNPKQYFYSFLNTLERNTALSISFDNSIAQIILVQLKSILFQSFSKDSLHRSTLKRRRLFMIADELYAMAFIGRQQYNMISMEKGIYLQNKLSLFLSFCKDIGDNSEEIEDMWNSVIEINMTAFWMQMEVEQIRHPILLEVYSKTKKCSLLVNSKPILQFIDSIIRQRKMISLPKQIEIMDTFELSNMNEQQEAVNMPQRSVERSFMRDNYNMEHSRIYEQVWFNSNKYEIYEELVQRKRSSGNTIQILLTEIAYEEALFFNIKHKELLHSIFSFIEEIRKKLDNKEVASYETFGSIRSTLALASQFDIDLTTIRDVSQRGVRRKFEREDDINLLFTVKKTLCRYSPAWVKNSYVVKFEKVKVPFLKIETNGESLERTFKLKGIEKLDITVGNKSAIKNSDMISDFAHMPEITLFCLLVKLWAKNNNVINGKVPMNGFSSYAIVLMCLYYLMETEQINFLTLNGEYDIDKSKIKPNFNHYQVFDLQQNFLGFLQFYKQTGVFQKKRKIVCLLQNCSQCLKLFDENIVINICDFIDGCNPGRLKYQDRGPVYSQFERAIRIMKNRSKGSIRDLITRKS